MGTPGTEGEPGSRVRFWRKWLNVSIALILFPPLIGCAGTVVGMIKSFRSLSLEGESDPSILSGDISSALVMTASGLVISVVLGVPLFVLALTKILRAKEID